MFFQPPDENLQIISSKAKQKNRRRRRKKKAIQKNKPLGLEIRKDSLKSKQVRFASVMSSWAESFASAATWQLKHQIAYWKAKAKALEYENKILHDIIKRNYVQDAQTEDVNTDSDESSSESVSEEINSEDNESRDEVAEDDCYDRVEENEEFEVSEEFIQFLRDNAKFKEDARQERELLKNKLELESKAEEERNDVVKENKEEVLKELYGKDWQRIAALEISLQSSFITEIDKDKPLYWPNIPFNFNFC